MPDVFDYYKNYQDKKYAKGIRNEGRQIERDATRALDEFQRQELVNAADSLSVRTEAQGFQAEQNNQIFANQLDVLAQGGNFGAATGLASQATLANQKIAGSIQDQRNRIDQVRASDAQNIRTIQDTNEDSEIAGLGAERLRGIGQRQEGEAALHGARQQTVGLVQDSYKEAERAIAGVLTGGASELLQLGSKGGGKDGEGTQVALLLKQLLAGG
ncbi:MAG: hypothetical protein K0U41_07025 [Gammaproteobacteria bacterium]|nr:hypothetical protein [Gammaproteobacteria bacterium]